VAREKIDAQKYQGPYNSKVNLPAKDTRQTPSSRGKLKKPVAPWGVIWNWQKQYRLQE